MSEQRSEREQVQLDAFERKLFAAARTSEPVHQEPAEGVLKAAIPIEQFDTGEAQKIDLVRGQLATSSRLEKLPSDREGGPKLVFANPKEFFKDFSNYAHGNDAIPSPDHEKNLIELAWRAYLAPNSVWEQGQAEGAASHFLELLSEKIGPASANEFFAGVKEKYAATLGTRSRIQYPNISARIKDQTLGRLERWVSPNKE